MPRYHLNVRCRDRLFVDEEGEEIAGEMAMRQQALETARDLIKTQSLAIPDWLDCTLEVTGEEGAVVLILPIAEAASGGRGASA